MKEMNLSVIKFNARARSGSSNIRQIFNLLPHIVENFLISVCTVLSDPCLEQVSVVGSGRRRHCPSQKPTKRNSSVSDQAVIGNKTLVRTKHELLVDLGDSSGTFVKTVAALLTDLIS
jgi:hypothetical protein